MNHKRPNEACLKHMCADVYVETALISVTLCRGSCAAAGHVHTEVGEGGARPSKPMTSVQSYDYDSHLIN